MWKSKRVQSVLEELRGITLIVIRLSSHSMAAALATNVFPVPGGP